MTVVEHIRAIKATQSREHITRQLFEGSAEHYFEQNRAIAMALVAPIVRG